MSSAAWQKLEEAALAHQRGNLETAKPLAEAAEAFARTRETTPLKAGGSGVVMPFGRSKGVAIEVATTADLKWVAERMRASLDDPAKARWRDANARDLAAIEAELGGR